MWLLTAGGAWLLLGVPVGAALLLGAVRIREEVGTATAVRALGELVGDPG